MKYAISSMLTFDDMPDLERRAAAEFERIDPDGPQAQARAQAIVTNSHVGLPDWVWDAPELRIIGNFGVGYDGIDTGKAAESGIWVSNTPSVLNDAVAELTLCLMTMAVRSIRGAEEYLRAGRWETDPPPPLSDTLQGRRLGLLGMGGIGREIASRASAAKMEISYFSRSPKEVPYEYAGSLLELAEGADMLCCIVPGGPETERLVDAQVLEALGPRGYLVNVSRGSVVDEAALIKALAGGVIAGAALDVFESEPHVPAELLAMPNVVAVPHIGSATMTARLAMGNLVLDNINAVLGGGKPLTPVNDAG